MRKLIQKEAEERYLDCGLALIQSYVNSLTSHLCICVKSSHTITKRLADAERAYGSTGCYECSFDERTLGLTFSQEEAANLYLEKGFELNEPYKKSMIPHICTCTVCGWIGPKRLNDVRQNYGCMDCGKEYRGFEKAIFNTLIDGFPHLQPNIRGLLKNKRFELDIWDSTQRKAIECDGPWHYKSMGRSGLLLEKRKDCDARKDQECADAGIRLLRLNYLESNNGKNYSGLVGKAIDFLDFMSTK